MSFTIKCDKCGKEQKFYDGDSNRQENIEIEVEQSHGYSGSTVDNVVIYCENGDCNHYIDIDY